jgi:chaperone required for assembly of F1-ATPase
MRDDLTDLFVDAQERDPLKAAQRDLKRPLPKRFYQEVTIGERTEGFVLLLDGKPVRTPARKLLAAPNLALAEQLAAEWRAQGEHINPATMPKTRLLNTALDGAEQSEAVAADIAKFAASDLVCYRAGAPENLVRGQAAAWDKVLEIAREKFGARFTCAEGVMFVAQPPESIAAIEQAVREQREAPNGPIRLAALHVMTTLTGSVLIALELIYGALTLDEAWAAAHVDEDFQTRLWGADDEALARRAARLAEMRSAYEVFLAVAA